MERLLLVGNSRWHWAEPTASGGLHCWHAAPPPELEPGSIRAWAAVGQLPPLCPLPPERRFTVAEVPLQALPPWLGVDRALVAWQAWRQQADAVLVADAGTALSLTWVDAQGRFRGGRISAGVALQLRSLGQATAQLPHLDAGAALANPSLAPWPAATAAAMEQGCVQAVAAAILQAWLELHPLESGSSPQLWLTGGDAARLARQPLLAAQPGLTVRLAPDLALEGLAALVELRPVLDR